MKLFELFKSEYKVVGDYYTSVGEGREISVGDTNYKIETSTKIDIIKNKDTGKLDQIEVFGIDFYKSGSHGVKKFTDTGASTNTLAVLTAVKDFAEEQINKNNPEYIKLYPTSDSRFKLYKTMIVRFLFNKYMIVDETPSSIMLKRK